MDSEGYLMIWMSIDCFRKSNTNQMAHINAQATGRAGARARCKIRAQTQVPINAK